MDELDELMRIVDKKAIVYQDRYEYYDSKELFDEYVHLVRRANFEVGLFNHDEEDLIMFLAKIKALKELMNEKAYKLDFLY